MRINAAALWYPFGWDGVCYKLRSRTLTKRWQSAKMMSWLANRGELLDDDQWMVTIGAFGERMVRTRFSLFSAVTCQAEQRRQRESSVPSGVVWEGRERCKKCSRLVWSSAEEELVLGSFGSRFSFLCLTVVPPLSGTFGKRRWLGEAVCLQSSVAFSPAFVVLVATSPPPINLPETIWPFYSSATTRLLH